LNRYEPDLAALSLNPEVQHSLPAYRQGPGVAWPRQCLNDAPLRSAQDAP
jgi:hypothetical protein